MCYRLRLRITSNEPLYRLFKYIKYKCTFKLPSPIPEHILTNFDL